MCIRDRIYEASKELVSVLPKDNLTKLIIKQAVEQLNTASQTVEKLRTMMNDAASRLPEYPVVMAMCGVGKSLGPQLMAELGDIRRFTHKGAITAFAGVDPGINESGSYEQKSVPTSKRGSAILRKTLFQVMDVLVKTKPQDDPVYLFMDKKRSQGKPYYCLLYTSMCIRDSYTTYPLPHWTSCHVIFVFGNFISWFTLFRQLVQCIILIFSYIF